MCYLGNPNPIPIIGKGLNSIPTIHIIDLIKIITRVIEKNPNDKSIFAVDKTKNPSLYNIIKSISLAIGDGKIKKMEKFDINDIYMENYQEMNIDVKILPSKICFDERKQNEDIEDYNKRKFKWRCEFGIPENLNLIRDEFNLYRGLKPVKIIIIGPPSSGKSNLCKLLNEKLKLPYLNIMDCINEFKNEKSELGEEIRNKYNEINENLEKIIEEYEKKKAKKKNEPPLDLNEYNKLPNELLIKIIKKKINCNQCISRGYIFDAFPKTYDDCNELYYDEIIKKIEKKENEEENEENKEEEKKEEKKKEEEKKKKKKMKKKI
jgi:adenylate kinase